MKYQVMTTSSLLLMYKTVRDLIEECKQRLKYMIHDDAVKEKLSLYINIEYSIILELSYRNINVL